jgi:hypothetical protein
LEFQVWQEEAGFLPAKADWDSGRFKVTLQPDETMDLGEVNIVPSLFKR